MAEVTRRTALALAAGAAIAPAPSAAAAEAAPPVSPVAAVLARHPWLNQSNYIENNALAGKLAEYLGWPGSAARAVVRAATTYSDIHWTDTAEYIADLDRRIAEVLASPDPLPRDRADGPEAEARFAALVAQIEADLSGRDPINPDRLEAVATTIHG